MTDYLTFLEGKTARVGDASLYRPVHGGRPDPLRSILGDAPAADLTARKTASIMRRDGSRITGFILTGETDIIGIVDKSAVRWITRKEFWWLMHESGALGPCPNCAPTKELTL